jgi:DNA-binding transcriptional LysR family regulator
MWLFRRDGAEEGEAEQVQPHGRIVVTDQIDGVLHAAVAGLGLTVVHLRAALPHLESGRLKTVLNSYRIDSDAAMRGIHVFFPHRAQIAPRVRALVDFLVADPGDDTTDCGRFAA